MYRLFPLLVFCAAALTAGNCVQGSQRCHGHCRAICPNCDRCCTFNAECGKEEKECYEVECVEICIPRVVFPWQKQRSCGHGGCDSCDGGCGKCSRVNNGARVKTVKKLKKKTYECPACKYEWTPARYGCGNCHANGCNGAGCDCDPVPEAEVEEPQEAYSLPLPTLDMTRSRPSGKRGRSARLKSVAQQVVSDG